MDEIGSFDLNFNALSDDDALNDGDDQLFLTLETSLLDFLSNAAVSEVKEAHLEKELTNGNVSKDSGSVTTNVCDGQESEERFKHVSQAEMTKLEDSHQSTKTRQNTKWAVKIFQGRLLNIFNSIFFLKSSEGIPWHYRNALRLWH